MINNNISFTKEVAPVGSYCSDTDQGVANFFKIEDVVKCIFYFLTPKKPNNLYPRSGLYKVGRVSKAFQRMAQHVKKLWIEEELIPIQIYRLDSPGQVLKFIETYDFRKVNLAYFSSRFNEEHLQQLAKLQKIVTLEIDCSITRKWPKMESLRSLILHQVTNEELSNLSSFCPNLTSIDLSNSKVYDLAELGVACLNLTNINLRNTPLTDIGLSEFSKTHSNVQIIDLAFTRITDKGLNNLLKNCLNIKSLILRQTIITGKFLTGFIHPVIEAIDLSDTQVKDMGLALAGKALPHLKIVNLSCIDVTNRGLAVFLKYCLCVEVINLSFTEITDKRLTRIMKTGVNLKEINLRSTQVTVRKIRILCSELPNLHVID